MGKYRPIAGNNSKFRRGLKKIVSNENSTLIAALVAIIIVFSLINGAFFSLKSFRNLFTFASLVGLIATGEAMLLISGQMDLGPGAVAAFAGVVAALLLQAGVPMVLTIVIVLLLGALIGMFNAFFINTLKISAFIVTLASQSIFRGAAQIMTHGVSIGINNEAFIHLGKPIIRIEEAGVLKDIMNFFSYPILIMALVLILAGILLNKTRFGREVYIVGGNPNAARLAGISVKKTNTLLFINMSVLASLGGLILAARMQSGNPAACINLEFEGITSAILGGVAMSGGFGTMSGVVLGLFILQSFNSGLIMAQVDPFWMNVARGVLMLLALSADYFRVRRRQKSTVIMLDETNNSELDEIQKKE